MLIFIQTIQDELKHWVFLVVQMGRKESSPTLQQNSDLES